MSITTIKIEEVKNNVFQVKIHMTRRVSCRVIHKLKNELIPLLLR